MYSTYVYVYGMIQQCSLKSYPVCYDFFYMYTCVYSAQATKSPNKAANGADEVPCSKLRDFTIWKHPGVSSDCHGGSFLKPSVMAGNTPNMQRLPLLKTVSNRL